jgi:hypothetical protein
MRAHRLTIASHLSFAGLGVLCAVLSATFAPSAFAQNSSDPAAGAQAGGVQPLAALSVNYYTPCAGVAGTMVSIYGAYFGSTQGTGYVLFTGTSTHATIQSWSDGLIQANVPSGATTGAVKVYANGGMNGTGPTFVVGTPSISPTSGSGGTAVAASNTCFSATSVKFNGVTASFSQSTYTVNTNVPSSATTGPLVVAGNANGQNYQNSWTFTVNKTATTTTLGSSLNPSTYGASVTFTATVSPSAATGTVTFKDNGTQIGTGTLSSGIATYTTTTLSVATHPITAAYGGDNNYNTSTSSTLNQVVNKANTTTSLGSSLNPSSYGTSVTFTSNVTPSTASGTVTFKDNGVQIGTGTLSGGTATYTTSTLSIATHPITASYGGDGNDNTSTSSTVNQVVNNLTTTVLTSSLNPSIFGSNVTFTATVSPSAATGTITFKDASTTIGTGTLSGAVATLTISWLALGSHSITGVYSGDGTYNGSTSPVVTQVVNAPTITKPSYCVF